MQKKTLKKHKTFRLLDLFMLLFLVGGILLLAYPFVSDALNDFLDQQLITIYQKKANLENEKEVAQQVAQQKKKNAALVKAKVEPGASSYTAAVAAKEKVKATKNYYQKHTIAVLKIPKIHLSLPIFDQTNEYFLQKGSTLLEGTSYPIGGINTHTVLSGHRGLPQATLFTNLPKLKIGDEFYIEINRQHHAYQVDKIQTIEPTNTASLKIQPGKDLVTLMTCTPYMVNTHRLLVTGHRIPYDNKKAQKNDSVNWWNAHLIFVWGILGLGGVFLFVWAIYRWFMAGFLARKNYRMVLYLLADGEPMIGKTVTVYSKNKKKTIKRDDEILSAMTDELGLLDFGLLAGGTYQLKLADGNEKIIFLKAYLEKRNSEYFSYRKNKQMQLNKDEHQIPVVDYLQKGAHKNEK
ncbi:MAG: class C sortase [Enterococcus sp.]|uniref:class C sortase n=1 Tax=Enterococcus sp. TaxID=35783 RepID=UPI002FCAE5EA